MKETLHQRIERYIDGLRERETLLINAIAKAVRNEDYTEASRLQTRLSVVRDILDDLKSVIK